jgi:hypothetical protein
MVELQQALAKLAGVPLLELVLVAEPLEQLVGVTESALLG